MLQQRHPQVRDHDRCYCSHSVHRTFHFKPSSYDVHLTSHSFHALQHYTSLNENRPSDAPRAHFVRRRRLEKQEDREQLRHTWIRNASDNMVY
ncbi:hypothetical protein TNCV_610871 [Trichonephila clavipes]|nr:hypothetical protein TNCV_610871 [Trichonephila clavipes]